MSTDASKRPEPLWVTTATRAMTREEMRFEAAKAAMQGMLANPDTTTEARKIVRNSIKDVDVESVVARLAVEQGDALLAALEGVDSGEVS